MTLQPLLEKIFLICLALGLTSRAIEKGVEAAFIGIGLISGVILFLIHTKWHFKSTFFKMKDISKKWEFRFLILALTSFAFSSYMGINSAYSLQQWQQVSAVFLGGSLLALGVHATSHKNIENWPKYIAFTGAGFSSLILLECLNTFPIISENIRDLAKAPLHTQIRSFSSVIAVVIPFAWVYALKNKSKTAWLLPILMTSGAFACGGRAGWLALTVTFIIFIFMFDWKSLTKRTQSKIIFTSHFALGMLSGLFVYKKMVGDIVFNQRIELSGAESGGSGRTEIWSFAWQSFIENPILGIGVKGFRHLDFSKSELTSTMHPHNAILEILLETGIIGAVCIFSFAGIALFKLIQTVYNKRKAHTENGLETAFIFSFFAFAVSSMTLTSIFHAWWLSFFVVIYTLSLKLRKF